MTGLTGKIASPPVYLDEATPNSHKTAVDGNAHSLEVSFAGILEMWSKFPLTLDGNLTFVVALWHIWLAAW